MEGKLFDYTKNAAYNMWVVTGVENTMSLWYCAEDIACFYAKNNIFNNSIVENIMGLPETDSSYLFYVRNIAYRLYVYTNRTDGVVNWIDAEMLISITSWQQAIINMAVIINDITNSGNDYSTWVKSYFKNVNG